MADIRLDRDKLKRRRETRGFNVPALARAVGVSSEHIYRIEWGTRRPSPRLYARLREVLDVNEEELLTDAPVGSEESAESPAGAV
jgi:transcriptional regulator with XRE-family HTH domain